MKVITGPIKTPNGRNFVTAVNGGGLGGPESGPGLVALHTYATSAGIRETFVLVRQPSSQTIGPGMTFALQTSQGGYVTAVNGGGIGGPNDATCPVHTDAVNPAGWEQFTLIVDDTANPPTVQIQTANGNYLTAVNGGGVEIHQAALLQLRCVRATQRFRLGNFFRFLISHSLFAAALNFSGQITRCPLSQLATFLELFSSFYKACAILPDGLAENILSSTGRDFEQIYYDSATMLLIAGDAQAYRQHRFDRPNVYAVPALPLRRPEDETPDVFFETIDKHSRWVARTAAVSLSFLTLAVILSGGTIKMTPTGGFEAQLPPLGTGIEALEHALGYAHGAPPALGKPGAPTNESLKKAREDAGGWTE